VFASDISEEMLRQIPKDRSIYTFPQPAERMIFNNNSIDVACTFATLHHIENITPVFREIYRVLKPRGIYYSDHDIESHFVKRYRIPLQIYRVIKNKKRSYAKINKEAGKLYDTVEYHKNGIDSDAVRIALTAIGFRVFISYHWEGILPVKGQHYKKGYAPMLRIIAIKQ
jgi:ubiquinone/menaquinone biosynthesis C-methylase UbiE